MTARLLRLPPLKPVDAAFVDTMFDGRQLRVNGKLYSVEQLPARPSVGAFCLRSEEGKQYDVCQYATGHHDCDCEDFTYRSGPTSRPCRHIAALAMVGIFSLPSCCMPAASPGV